MGKQKPEEAVHLTVLFMKGEIPFDLYPPLRHARPIPLRHARPDRASLVRVQQLTSGFRGKEYSLKNPNTDLPTQPSEKFDKCGELDIGMAFFHTGDEAFLGSDSIGQLLLSKTSAEPLFFELLSDNKGITFHLKLIPLRGSDLPEILGNEVFDGC